MITRILKLIKDNNINAKILVSSTGLSSSSITEWKKGRANPSADAVIKIADYFGVSTDYILTGKENDQNLSELDLELLQLFRKLDEKDKLKFLGKAELLINDMLHIDKNQTGT